MQNIRGKWTVRMVVPDETSLKSIAKKSVIEYEQALLETPNRYTMRYPCLTLPQAIKANAKLADAS